MLLRLPSKLSFQFFPFLQFCVFFRFFSRVKNGEGLMNVHSFSIYSTLGFCQAESQNDAKSRLWIRAIAAKRPLFNPFRAAPESNGRKGLAGTFLICQGTIGDARDFCFYPRNDTGDVFEKNAKRPHVRACRRTNPSRFHDTSDTCFQFLREAKSNTRRMYITCSIIRT